MVTICSQIMRNKKDLHLALSMDELETKTKLPDKIKHLNLQLFVYFIFF